MDRMDNFCLFYVSHLFFGIFRDYPMYDVFKYYDGLFPEKEC